MKARAWITLGVLALLLTVGAAAALQDGKQDPAPRSAAPASAPATIVEQLKSEAQRLQPLFKTALVRGFLAEVQNLPPAPRRTVHRTKDKQAYFTAQEHERLSDAERSNTEPLALKESFYYTTRYGSPLAYCRALELLAEAGISDLRGRRVADFGYGTAGHLRLLAALGGDVVGVDVDPLLRVLYSAAEDQGKIKGAETAGTLKLVTGRWPADDATRKAVGGDFDVFMSKNTLKNGYVNPQEGVDPRLTVQLGVSNEDYVKAVYAALKPGGVFLIYNICPAPAKPGQPVIPWADGRCPFSAELLRSAGFELLAFDESDDAAARAMGRALGWDAGAQPMDLENDLFTWYTIARKPAK